MAQNITIAKLNTLVTANATQFMSELSKTTNVAQRAGAAIQKALGAVGIGLSVGAVVAFGKSVIDFGSQITDLSTMAGMGSDSFQTLSAKAAESGVTMEMVAKGAENLRSKLQDAADGNQQVRDELGKLKLSFAGLISLAPEKQWEAVARAAAESKDQQQALNIVSDLFGAKIGPKLKEVLQALAGKDGFAGLSEQMKGLRIDKESLKSLDDAGDALTNLWTKIKIFGSQGLIGALNIVKDDFNAISNIKGGNGKTVGDSFRAIGSSLGFNNDAADAFNKGDGTTKNGLHFGLEKSDLGKKLGEDMAKGAKAWSEAHPWDAITMENAQQSKIKTMLDQFFGPIDEKAKGLHDMRTAINFPSAPTDRLTRIGLLNDGSKTIADETKKQTDLLKGVISELKSINTKTGATVATFA